MSKVGWLEILPVQARATQHDEEPSPSTNVNLCCLKSNLLPHIEVPPPPLPLPTKSVVPRRILPHPDTNHHATQPLVGHPQSTPNTLVTTTARESPVAVVREVPGGDPSSPARTPHMVCSLPARSPVSLAAASTTAIGRIVAPLPRYATSHNHPETWNVGFMDIESESEAQLLSALPPPIRRHQAQSHSLGTANTQSMDVGQGGGTQVRCQQQVLPVYSECSSVRDSVHVPVSTQYHHSNVAPAPLSLASYTHVETLQSQYYLLGVQQQVQRPAQRLQQTQGFQGAVMYGVRPAEATQHQQHQQQPAVLFPQAYDPYQRYPYPHCTCTRTSM